MFLIVLLDTDQNRQKFTTPFIEFEFEFSLIIIISFLFSGMFTEKQWRFLWMLKGIFLILFIEPHDRFQY